MKRIFLICLLSIICTTGFAQGAGYLGHHLIIQADGSMSPGAMWLAGFLPDNKFSDYLFAKPIVNVSPKIEYLVWRQGTVALAYTYYSNKIAHKWDTPYKANCIGVSYKQYYGGRAPMGKFIEYKLNNYLIQAHNSSVERGYNQHICYDLGIGLATGEDFLLMNRLRLSWSIYVNLNAGTISSIFKSDDARSTTSLYITDSNYIGLSLGIGVLAF